MTSTLDKLVRDFEAMHLPIGVYFTSLDGQLLACNGIARRLLHLPTAGPIDANIADFYAEPQMRAVILEKAYEHEQQGKLLTREIIRFHVNGNDLFAEVYARSLRDPTTDEVLGYAVCIVDVTQEQAEAKQKETLQKRVEELTFDIGRVLHANTSILLMTQQTLDSVAEVLGQQRLDEVRKLSTEELDEQLLPQAVQLAAGLERLLQIGDAERRLQALPQARWERLNANIYPLRNLQEVIPVMEMRLPSLRQAAHEVMLICREIQMGMLPREPVRDVLQLATQVAQMACLADLLTTRTAIVQMDHTLRSLRDFVTADVRKQTGHKRLLVRSLIEQIIAQLAEFAKSSRVEIRWRDRQFDAQIEGDERELVRALANLLHNAIKYSWRRDRAATPWVTIRTTVRERMVHIEFENWGVPITRDEIESGIVFELGYRGKLAKDRGRLGTGIGLTDAHRVALTHQGVLQVNSRPAHAEPHAADDEAYYNQPFITTITMVLPI